MKHRSTFLASTSLFACFCLLVAGGTVSRWFRGSMLAWGIVMVEIVAFLAPAAFLIFSLRKAQTIRIPVATKRLSASAVHFSIRLGITVSLASFLLNILIVQVVGRDISIINPASFQASDIGGHPIIYILAVAIVPALVEEIYVRGVVFQLFLRYTGTGMGILLSALVFAMLHGSFYNFAGPILGGIIFSWLTFTYGSIWPAVIAHAVNNLFFLTILWLTDAYSAFGIWSFFPSICLLLLILFLYLSLRSAERLFLNGQAPHFAQGQSGIAALRTLFGNPASLAFVAVFLAKTVLGVI